MGPVNWLAVLVAAFAAFAVGAIWYGALFSKAWQRATGFSDAEVKGISTAAIFGATFLLELISAAMLGHFYARVMPSKPFIYLMMSCGLAIAFIIPAMAVNYIHLRKSWQLFAIDAVHWLVAYAAMGAVFLGMG